MSGVFCDFVQVTVPRDEWQPMRADVEPLLAASGMWVETDQGDAVLWRGAGFTPGTAKAARYGNVVALGASGACLATLRAMGLFGEFLARMGSRPHRVTRCDASLDVGEDAAPVIARLADAVDSEQGLSLSRKAIPGHHVTRLVSRRPDGLDTGTIYLGSPKADVRMCVYDKRHEQMMKGLPIDGPLTRYELRLRSGTGVTLRDAAEPASVFWHYVAPDVLPRPAGVPEWVPHGTGYELERRAPPDAAQRLLWRIQQSPEILALAKLAAEVGPYGFPLMVSEMRKLLPAGGAGSPRGDREPVQVGQATDAGALAQVQVGHTLPC